MYKRCLQFLIGTLVLCLAACASQEATVTPQPLVTETSAPTVEPTTEPTSTPTPQPLKVTLHIFHDHNGNATQDEGEPDVGGVTIEIDGQPLEVCTSGIDGDCVLHAPPGSYDLSISSDDYGYIRLDPHSVIATSNTFHLDIHEEKLVSLALNHDILDLPFDDAASWYIVTYQDRCTVDGEVCNWKGTAEFTRDGHTCGMDIGLPAGSEVLYPGTEGVIEGIFEDGGLGAPSGYILHIRDGATGWESRILDFGHIQVRDGLEVGDTLRHGDLMGHVHPASVYSQDGIHFGIGAPGGECLDLYDTEHSLFIVPNPQPPF